MENDVMIRFENVTKTYNSKTGIIDLSFQVKQGEFFGYLGPNGAGKTTSIKSMIGLVHPEKGDIFIGGKSVSSEPEAVRSIIGYVPDSPFIYEKLTAIEFLRFVGGLYRMKPNEIEKKIEWLVDIFEMKDWMHRKSQEYSHGMKQKVVMSAAFMHNPELIIVDEPTVGLDPPSQRLLKDMLKLIQKNGTTVFMSSHNLSEVEELCEHMIILHKGKIVAEGTLEDLRTKAQMEGGSLENLFLKLTGNITKTAYL
ncbi:ABC transporter ATP-binding protein [Candidatus Latescibacterota bacterium]